ncbi:beta-microseminoprotein-like [Acipenser oxyrinchus oxyrinchus]|uniref:Beta-microseminoprotein-like n=1 Tax=Acipenser oxyrinchus oxyrinchus TaxID=40147 RepID=A0AAD8CMA7_ACIOX|nr:beta-microseminoprotein-like [Acipenser oxyrinchus oxyrinchus]
MKLFLTCALLLCAALHLSQSQCMEGLASMEISADGQYMVPTHCTDPFDSTPYPIGAEWRTGDCMECLCEGGGFRCCPVEVTRPERVPEDCVLLFDEERCGFKAFNINNPSESCPL